MYTLYTHAYSCTWYWQKLTWKFCVELLQRALVFAFGFYAAQCFWETGNFFCYFTEITSLFLKIQFALHQAGRTFALLKYLSCGLNDIWNMNVVVFPKVRWLIHILIKKTFFLDSKDLMWNVILYSVSVCSFISNGLTYCVISIHYISLINFSMNNFRVRLVVKTSWS